MAERSAPIDLQLHPINRFPALAGRHRSVRLPRPWRREVKQLQRIFAWTQSHFAALRADEEGQTMAEYAVILALITAAVVGVMTLLGTNILNVIETVAGYIVPG